VARLNKNDKAFLDVIEFYDNCRYQNKLYFCGKLAKTRSTGFGGRDIGPLKSDAKSILAGRATQRANKILAVINNNNEQYTVGTAYHKAQQLFDNDLLSWLPKTSPHRHIQDKIGMLKELSEALHNNNWSRATELGRALGVTGKFRELDKASACLADQQRLENAITQVQTSTQARQQCGNTLTQITCFEGSNLTLRLNLIEATAKKIVGDAIEQLRNSSSDYSFNQAIETVVGELDELLPGWGWSNPSLSSCKTPRNDRLQTRVEAAKDFFEEFGELRQNRQNSVQNRAAIERLLHSHSRLGYLINIDEELKSSLVAAVTVSAVGSNSTESISAQHANQNVDAVAGTGNSHAQKAQHATQIAGEIEAIINNNGQLYTVETASQAAQRHFNKNLVPLSWLTTNQEKLLQNKITQLGQLSQALREKNWVRVADLSNALGVTHHQFKELIKIPEDVNKSSYAYANSLGNSSDNELSLGVFDEMLGKYPKLNEYFNQLYSDRGYYPYFGVGIEVWGGITSSAKYSFSEYHLAKAVELMKENAELKSIQSSFHTFHMSVKGRISSPKLKRLDGKRIFSKLSLVHFNTAFFKGLRHLENRQYKDSYAVIKQAYRKYKYTNEMNCFSIELLNAISLEESLGKRPLSTEDCH
jgi:DNA-binding FrmR family transcriptional regulator